MPKKCPSCQEIKDESEFYHNKKTGKPISRCKICHNRINAKWKKEHKDKRKEYEKVYHNRPDIKAKRKFWTKRWVDKKREEKREEKRKSNPYWEEARQIRKKHVVKRTIKHFLPRKIYGVVKNSADKRKIPLLLTREEFTVWWENYPDRCAYCGLTTEQLNKILGFLDTYIGDDRRALKFIPIARQCHKLTRLSVDRIDSVGGYSKENITKSCIFCNIIKGRMLDKEHIDLIAKSIMKQLFDIYNEFNSEDKVEIDETITP